MKTVRLGTWDGKNYSIDGIAYSFRGVMKSYGFRWVRGPEGGCYFGDRAAAERFEADFSEVGVRIEDMRDAPQNGHVWHGDKNLGKWVPVA